MLLLRRQRALQTATWVSPVLLKHMHYWDFISLIRGLILHNDYCASQIHVFHMNRSRASELQCCNSGFDLQWINYLHKQYKIRACLVLSVFPWVMSFRKNLMGRKETRAVGEMNAKHFMRWVGFVWLLFTSIKPELLLLQTAGIATSSLGILKNTSGNLLKYYRDY